MPVFEPLSTYFTSKPSWKFSSIIFHFHVNELVSSCLINHHCYMVTSWHSWKRFPHYWPFVNGNDRRLCLHKGPLIWLAWKSRWTCSWIGSYLRRRDALWHGPLGNRSLFETKKNNHSPKRHQRYYGFGYVLHMLRNKSSLTKGMEHPEFY